MSEKAPLYGDTPASPEVPPTDEQREASYLAGSARAWSMILGEVHRGARAAGVHITDEQTAVLVLAGVKAALFSWAGKLGLELPGDLHPEDVLDAIRQQVGDD